MRWVAFVIPVFVMGLCSCAGKSEIYALDERIYQTEQNDRVLQNSLAQLKTDLTDEKEAYEFSQRQIRDQVASMSAEMEGIREEIQLLRGMLEETNYTLKKKTGMAGDVAEQRQSRFEHMEQTFVSIQSRLARIERYLNLEVAPAAIKQPPATAPSSAPPKPATDIEAYNAAKAALDKGDVETARKGFQDLIIRFPKSSHADNAQFWIGEIFYREKWYEKAILEYQKVIEKYPKGNKVGAALLKQGLAFYSLGDKANARLILKELINKFPQSNEAQIARQKLKAF